MEAPPFLGGHVGMFDCRWSANRLSAGLFLRCAKTRAMEQRNIESVEIVDIGQGRQRESAAYKSYVRRVTAGPVQCKSLSCQGLHNATFLPYGSWQVERSACLIASKRLELEKTCRLVAALPGG
jgi:hypothetical protein